ncbi:putative carbonic anhydrase 2 isoform X2 [Amyelois transitella]|uniref:putative carbonic anhydrase 2 isoform X2 n=1 Tax=Amyelois transitella TaxID=680683 RepID=UPI00067DE24E|nr:putative carbonic anhydrase 2 isoform X2 [Amyelois transitella]
MAKFVSTVALLALLAISISAIPGKRTRRGFNNSGYNSGGGYGSGGEYGRGSDERDTSSQEGNGCSSENGRSREYAYNRDGRQFNENSRGTRSFAKASASAAASAYNINSGSKNLLA